MSRGFVAVQERCPSARCPRDAVPAPLPSLGGDTRVGRPLLSELDLWELGDGHVIANTSLMRRPNTAADHHPGTVPGCWSSSGFSQAGVPGGSTRCWSPLASPRGGSHCRGLCHSFMGLLKSYVLLLMCS